MLSASCGVPPVVTTVVASLMVAVTLTTSPMLSVLATCVLGELMARLLMTGALVSTR